MKISVKIIEQNKNRCEHLSELLPDATIINGDGTNRLFFSKKDFLSPNPLSL